MRSGQQRSEPRLASFAGNDRRLADTIFTFRAHPQHSPAA
jgi:hypothetical protein